MKPNDRQIDDIVAMLDQFMAQNGGHMDIRVEQDEDGAMGAGTAAGTDKIIKTLMTTRTLECGPGNMACAVPTLFEGLDGDDNTNTEYDNKGVHDDECKQEPN